jgi:hypothetical protein
MGDLPIMTMGSRFSGGAGAADWKTAKILNFAALPDQAFPINGVYVVDGSSVEKLGQANTENAFCWIKNGVGFYPAPNGGISPGTNDFTRPTLLIRLKQFLADLTWTTPFRLTWIANSAGDARNGSNLFGAVGSYNTTGVITRNAAFVGSLANNDPMVRLSVDQGAIAAGASGSLSPGNSNVAGAVAAQTFRVTMPNGAASGDFTIEIANGTALWAPESDYRMVSAASSFAITATGYSNIARDPTIWTPDTIGVEVGGYGNGLATWGASIKALKIETK